MELFRLLKLNTPSRHGGTALSLVLVLLGTTEALHAMPALVRRRGVDIKGPENLEVGFTPEHSRDHYGLRLNNIG
ncbi:MAG: hypothetical protein AAB638_01020, partial [Patescibacteria group bacterium]